MAFNEANPPRRIVDAGFTGGGSTAAGNVYMYRSSDPIATVAAVGYLTGCGWQSRAGPQVGMRIGDLCFVVESSAGANPGKVNVCSVVNSTAAISAASPLPSSAHAQRFNVSLSTG